MAERKLVTIREVREIVPIDGADNIELAKVDGWQCVVQKGAFIPGAIGAFHEIDSIVPLDKPWYAFLSKKPGQTHHRIKSIKLRGTLSQGLLIHTWDIDGLAVFLDDVDTIVGTDVTEFCGVTKYEPPQGGVSLRAGVRSASTFPVFLPKTDLERCQNLREEIADSITKHETFAVEAKMDGSSLTAYYEPGDGPKPARTSVCSRNQEIIEDDSLTNPYWNAVRSHKWDLVLPVICSLIGGTVAMQGELCGPKIQGNPLGLTENRLFLFDIYSVRLARYLLPRERYAILEALKIGFGNIVGVDLFHVGMVPADIDTMLSGVDVIYQNLLDNGDPPLEGIVFKSESGPFRFKVVSNAYLLAHNG